MLRKGVNRKALPYVETDGPRQPTHTRFSDMLPPNPHRCLLLDNVNFLHTLQRFYFLKIFFVLILIFFLVPHLLWFIDLSAIFFFFFCFSMIILQFILQNELSFLLNSSFSLLLLRGLRDLKKKKSSINCP